MNRIDLTNLGGFPLEQDTLKFIQDNYTAAMAAIAQLCGSKTILYGVQVIDGNVTDGWIAYNGELIQFVGGVAGDDVVISETAVSKTFEDGTDYDTYFTKVATCGVGGVFPFSDLVPLLSLQNIWKKDDIRECMKDAAYVTANFDTDGYGSGPEIGWRIMSKAYTDSAGKVFVNLDSGDTDFNTVGNHGGEKAHVLVKEELPDVTIEVPIPAVFTSQDDPGTGKIVGGGGTVEPSALNSLYTAALGSNTPHNNVQPFFVILKLIKL